MNKTRNYIRILLLMLLLGGMASEAWAYNVTYHVLALPMDNTKGTKNTRPMYDGWRTEAITVIAENVYTVELPEKYQSPLAWHFKYYDASSIDTYPGGAQEIYGGNDASSNNNTKFILYQVNGSATELAEGSSLTNNCDIYVTYEYNAANTIADLSGNTVYNLTLKDGFLAFNRGRNNRVSIIPKATPRFSDLTSETFTKVNVSGTGVNGYWNSSSENKNKREDVESQFHFLFKYEGEDPYNITIRTAYEGDKYYVEKYAVAESEFMNKYYKNSSVFAEIKNSDYKNNNCFLASDDNVKYTTPYGTAGVTLESRPGFYRNFVPVWNSFALLNSTDADHPGYVYMGSRITYSDGSYYTPEKKSGKYQYYYLKNNGNNNIIFEKMDHESASKNHFADDQMYKIRTFKFIVNTAFFDYTAPSKAENAAHKLIESVDLSEYTERYSPISIEHVPSLKRKYCNYKFYKDLAHQHEITKYTELEGTYTVYVGCELSSDCPFKPIKPTDSYTTATWYELTDKDTNDKILKWNGNSETPDYKKDGTAKGTVDEPYQKESEFAFVGDPYELKVINRKWTEEENSFKYVGSSLGVNSSSINVVYGANYTFDEPYDTQTMTIEVTGLPYTTGSYITVEKSGDDDGQVTISTSSPISISPFSDDLVGVDQNHGSANFEATITSASGSDKTFTLTIQAKNSSHENVGACTVITINQKAESYSWDIPDDNTAGSFLLRKYKSNEGYWNWESSDGNPLRYSTSPTTRTKIIELPELTYYYNIVDLAGNIAARASIKQTVFSPLSHSSIPSIIYSPFLLEETLTFYDKDSYVDKNSDGNVDRRDFSDQTRITQTSGIGDVNIFVTYTTAQLSSKPVNLSESQQFNVKLNGQYIYYDDGSIKSKASPSNDELSSNAYMWLLRNRDPYNMIIDNEGARTALSVSGSSNVTVYADNGTPSEVSRTNGAWVRVDGGTWGDDKSIGFTATRAEASHFIAKSSTTPGAYEVMAADGSVDASSTYYHIGRSADNTVKIYSNSSYKHGDDQLKFVLEQSYVYTYHLIDKDYKDLLQVTSKSPDLVFPAEYQSPLVTKYYYWKASAFVDAVEDGGTDFHFTDSPTPTEITSVTEATNRDIYVTYDVDEQFGFGTKNPYMLKFLNGKKYKLEDGNDKLIKGEKMQAMYPYCNGDGNLNIYGEKSNREQMEGGSSTRPRWVWFIESENHDPYHVKIHSRSAISFGGASNWTYLHTSAVHFKQDANQNTKHIVTGGNLQGISQVPATEYMILGQKNPGSSTKYKLLTTYPINETVVDGVADKDKRQYVTSFEQYWKTYNMLKKYVLEIDEDVNSSDPTTYVMPDSKWGELKTKLTALGVNESTDLNYIDNCVWHSYEAVANAQRWNGYNAAGEKSKTVEKLEHWFQSFDMGDGTFEIESADIPAVLVLLDRHGWEIMRKAIPTGDSDLEAAAKLAALKAYDSPMVKEYKFYSNATKADGCHKYVLRMQNNAERDPIKVDGKQFTSTSLATLPKLTADSYGTYSDIFVTYTVKEEYDKSYKYSFTDNGGTSYTESGTPSAFLFIQNGNYAKDDTDDSDLTDIDAVATGGDVSGYIIDNIDELTTTGTKKGEMWYLQPNLHIDKEMGIVWATETERSNEPKTEYETKVAYKDKTGFDPYNLQIESVAQPGYYLTTHMKSTARSGDGGMVGNYEGGSKNVNLAEWVNLKDVDTTDDQSSESYDHTYIQLTNQTFMAVQDANGNMQLMPRFDHTQRINAFTTLADAVTHSTQASVNDPESGSPSMGVQTTFFVRPMLFNYIIVDNQGRESLRYQSAGEFYPFTPEHFKSPLATDFKYYFGHAAYKISASSKAAYDAAAEDIHYFQRTTANDEAMETVAKTLEVLDDFYFRIGSTAPYTYKKVTVTKAHSEKENATYTVSSSNVNDWTNADVKGAPTVVDETAMETAIKAISAIGTYYYKIGSSTYTYKKVIVTKVTTTSSGDGIYYDVANKVDLSSREITGSFAAADINESTNDIYVRYSYDVSASDSELDKVILEGKWLTVKLNEHDVYATGTLNNDGTGVSLRTDTKPTEESDPKLSEDTKWHWKFLASPHVDASYYKAPDPYAVQIFNRKTNYDDPEAVDPTNNMSIAIKISNVDRFVILSHEDGGYALAQAGREDYNYYFLQGIDNYGNVISSSVPASVRQEAGFTRNTNTFDDVKSQLLLTDDISHSFTYKVITNDKKLAISGTNGGFTPNLPIDISSPLLNTSDYSFYGTSHIAGDIYNVDIESRIETLYGLYDDVVYVRYKYNKETTPYGVPNKRNATGGGGTIEVDPASNDAALDIEGTLPYNIIWTADNMMQSTDGSAISDGGSNKLSGEDKHIWYFENNDPYALRIKHQRGKYVDGDGEMAAQVSDAKTFMLLRKNDYDYGILQVTGDDEKLTGFGNALTPDAATAPEKFIIFALSTHKLIYHLVISKTDDIVYIPYSDNNNPKDPNYVIGSKKLGIKGTSQRDLISMTNGVLGDKYQLGNTISGETYSFDAGQVSIGDILEIPSAFNRPNCNFFFYIDNIQTKGAATYQETVSSESVMETAVSSISSVGDYYYKITDGKIYRKVHVTTAKDGLTPAVYEISTSTKDAYDAASTSTTFQRTADNVEAMKSDATSITILGDHYYKINGGESYYRFTKYPVAVSEGENFVVCKQADWDNAVASKESGVADEAAMKTAADELTTIGDHYYEIGTLTLYKKVHVTGVSPVAYTVVDCTEDDWDNAWQDNVALNDEHKGKQVTELMPDAGLIESLVKVNIAYSFKTGLETNAGEGFVTSVGDNLWYTFETLDGGKPFLSHYTNAWGLQSMEGRNTRYTNDYLWTPLGDVYGFKMYNRYMLKNSGGTENVMTMPSITEGEKLLLHLPDAQYTEGNEIFELLGSNTEGYFRIHPVVNNTGTMYYVRKNSTNDNYTELSTTASVWTFGLDMTLLKPYIDRMGYVGGLTKTAYTTNQAVLDKVRDGTAEYADLIEVQDIVYDDDNIVKYKPGYYRLHSQPDVSGLTTVRYASGYLHEIEKTAVSGGIPMHFYSKKGSANTTFETLETGFTISHATRGDIPVPATEYDPSTIFYFGENTKLDGNPYSKMQTQGLYVASNANGDAASGTTTNRLQRAVMVAPNNDNSLPSNVITFSLMDIGGAVLLIHDGAAPAQRRYLNFDQSNHFQRTAKDDDDMTTQANKFTSKGDYYFKIGESTYKKLTVNTVYVAPSTPATYSETTSTKDDWDAAADIYDLKYYHESPTDDAKWCMEPANNQGLLVETHNGGDGYYYTTFCAPYDVLLPPDEGESTIYNAYVYKKDWPTSETIIHPVRVPAGDYTIGKFVPAATPVIIRTTDNSGKIKLSLPSSAPSDRIDDCKFSGKYLEQLLATEITSSDKVYAFGLPITGYDLNLESGGDNGTIINYVNRNQANTGVGFYINATHNKELDVNDELWYPNNRYVIHNKIYYRTGSNGASSREQTRSPEFIPVVFDDDDEEEDEPIGESLLQRPHDNRVYDLLGRCVATGEEVANGTWRSKVASGIYILNGRKIYVK